MLTCQTIGPGCDHHDAFTVVAPDRWQQIGGWHPEMAGTQNRLFRIGTVRQAAAKVQALYCWYGPPVTEYVVASGSSEELDAYLSTKLRPRG